MSADALSPLWDRLHDEIGDDLRGVVVYDGPTYDIRTRANVSDLYEEQDYRTMAEEFFRISMDRERQSHTQPFAAGEFRGFTWIFDDAYINQYVNDEFSGVVVSIDRTPNPPLGRVERVVADYLQGPGDPFE